MSAHLLLILQEAKCLSRIFGSVDDGFVCHKVDVNNWYYWHNADVPGTLYLYLQIHVHLQNYEVCSVAFRYPQVINASGS